MRRVIDWAVSRGGPTTRRLSFDRQRRPDVTAREPSHLEMLRDDLPAWAVLFVAADHG
jgi:hypothetical protein